METHRPTTDKQKTDNSVAIASGVSSAIGAAAGIVAGTFIAQDASAAETPDTTPEPQPESAPATTTQHHTTQPSQPTVPSHSTSQPTAHHTSHTHTQPIQQTVEEPTHEMEVTDFEYMEDGGSIATLNVDGQEVYVADVDGDGEADYLLSDLNNNGQLEDNEIVDIQGEGVRMEQLSAQVNHEPDTDPTTEPDIIVTGYEHFDDGSSIATLNMDGQDVFIGDVDGDGIADVLAGDFNSNGQLDTEEMIDIQDQNVDMSQLEYAYASQYGAGSEDPTTYYASNDPDYVNDGNVDDFLA